MLWETDHLPYKGLRGEALELKNPLDGVLLSIMNIHTFRATTGCSLNVVFFPQNFVIFLNSAKSAAALVFYLPGVCTHTDTKGIQERPESGIFLKNRKKNNI